MRRFSSRCAARISAIGLAVACLPTSDGEVAQTAPASVVQERASDLAPNDALALVRADEQRRVAALAEAAESVVCIFDSRQCEGGGSGVIIHPDGYGLTNFHVVESFLETRNGFGGLRDGKLYPLRVLGIDPGGDVVMFKLSGRERFEAAKLGDSDRVRVGQWVVALGNPFLVAEDYSPTVTLGIVSGVRRYQEGQENLLEYADCIQVSTSINPGNSGGPLFDLTPCVIGINGRASFEERGRVNVGLGYAISINQIKRFMPGLRAGRLVEHGTLGMTVRRAGDSVIIDAIQALSPAEQAGLELGDEVLEVAGRAIHTPNDYNNILGTMPADWPVLVRVRRAEREVATTARTERVTLGAAVVYAPDMEHNWSEMRRALRPTQARVHQRDRLIAGLRVSGAENTAPLELSLTTSLRESATPLTSQPAENATLAVAVEREWTTLTRLLMTPFEPKFGDEMIGGDEMDGRIVETHQRRDGAVALRWSFDAETGELRAVRFQRDGKDESVWEPLLTDGAFPNVWRRTDASGEQNVQVLSLSYE